MNSKANIINASPTKKFFIDMLTRDISVIGCILDLIDNAVHSVIRQQNLNVMDILLGRFPDEILEDANIKISFDKDYFKIEDTCGGILRSVAQDEIFRFGIVKERKNISGLGVYGIGMKRAFFKLGRDIFFTSRTKKGSFAVHILVDEWKKSKEWEFEFLEDKSNWLAKPLANGTTVIINNLNKTISDRFRNSTFQGDVIKRISTTYVLYILSGIKIFVNDIPLEAKLPLIGDSPDLSVARQRFNCEGVDVLIVAGVTPWEDTRPHGWYIFCNGRMILEADKTDTTGWGINLPSFHTKYNHFAGYVYFKSKDLLKLPWTTTKRSVDIESDVYQCALKEMGILARPITNFLNRLYQKYLEVDGIAERDLMQKTKAITLDKIPKKESRFSPPPKKQIRTKYVRIQYKKPHDDLDKIKAALKEPKMSAKKIGEYTFDYYIEKECD